MREDWFYILKDNIFGNKINLSGEEFLHLTKVLRHRVGDNVKCFYDGSNILNCKIDQISKNSATLTILGEEICQSNPKVKVTLYQGLPKQDKLELIAKMTTEIGISEIAPFKSTYTLGSLEAHKRERLEKIVISACKQCGRTQLTKILDVKPLNEIDFSSYDCVIFANERENLNSIASLDKQLLSAKSIAYIVGAEGGFEDSEIDSLKKRTHSVTLGKRILRTESASIAILSYLSLLLGV